ncbi:MAG: hypothetical protein H6828_11485 [Planctomycetes bacterium]|nr:hypothetical protein [Planctomycetota bacterium]
MKKTLILLLPLLAAFTACKSEPKRIDPYSDEAVTSAGVDYPEIREWIDKLADQMLRSGVLDSPEFGAKPIKMVCSTIENNTDLSHFPTDILVGRLKDTIANSGKVRFVTTYGSQGTDDMTRDTRELANDPLFDSSQAPPQGTASVARLSLRTQISWIRSQGTKQAQNTYEVRMFVTDVLTGEQVWGASSDPIAKKVKKGSVGW